jgi:hypothetical protein
MVLALPPVGQIGPRRDTDHIYRVWRGYRCLGVGVRRRHGVERRPSWWGEHPTILDGQKSPMFLNLNVLFASKQHASFLSKKKDLMSEKSEKSDLSLLRIDNA